MTSSNERSDGSQVERQERLRYLIEEVTAKRLSGSALSDPEVIERNKDLLPELRDELAELARVEEARARAQADGSSGSDNPYQKESLSAVPASFPGYEQVTEIHRGGQGVVYHTLHKATRRRVAIKVIKSGPHADPRDRARFEREAQVLGSLNHPHIVTIHDTGEAAGHFYFVMDFIEGRPLDAYMAETKCSVRDALRLFAKICDAVNAAHLRGVIHRDLKPSNIRVDNQSDPHVLDFGLAKFADDSTAGDGPLRPEITITGQFVGTPAWASPEQARGDSDSVDIRADVYGLGLLLYQMLTGQLPYSIKGDSRTILDRILHVEPTKPSSIRRQVDDEVETIVLKCLRKEPARRYQSAGELGRDIQHYLNGEPIEAKRDSGWYVFTKSVRRHRLLVGGIAFTFAALLVGTIGMTQGKISADKARQEAVGEAQKSAAINRVLRDVLMSPSSAGRGHDARMADVLDDAAQKIESSLSHQPLSRAELYITLAETYQMLALHKAAELHAREALEIRDQLLGKNAPATFAAVRLLGRILTDANQFDEAAQVLEEAVPRARQALVPHDPEIPKLLEALGWLRSLLGRDDKGATIREALEIRRRYHAQDAEGLADCIGLLGVQRRGRDDDEAYALISEAKVILEGIYGPESAPVATALSNLAIIRHYAHGRIEEALELYTRALTLLRRHFGDDHPNVASTLNPLGLLHHGAKRYDEAQACYQEALRIHREYYGDHNETRLTLNNLSMLAKERGDVDAAIAYAREAAEMSARIFRPDDPAGEVAWRHLGALADELRQNEVAEEAWRGLLTIRERRSPQGSFQTAEANFFVGRALFRQKKLEEAETFARKCLEMRIQFLGVNDAMTAVAERFLGQVLTEQAEYGEAEELLLRAFQKLKDAKDVKFGDQVLEALIVHYRARNDDESVAQYSTLLDERKALAGLR